MVVAEFALYYGMSINDVIDMPYTRFLKFEKYMLERVQKEAAMLKEQQNKVRNRR